MWAFLWWCHLDLWVLSIFLNLFAKPCCKFKGKCHWEAAIYERATRLIGTEDGHREDGWGCSEDLVTSCKKYLNKLSLSHPCPSHAYAPMPMHMPCTCTHAHAMPMHPCTCTCTCHAHAPMPMPCPCTHAQAHAHAMPLHPCTCPSHALAPMLKPMHMPCHAHAPMPIPCPCHAHAPYAKRVTPDLNRSCKSINYKCILLNLQPKP